MAEPAGYYNETSTNETDGAAGTLAGSGATGQAQSYRHKQTSQALEKQPSLEIVGGEKSSVPYRPPRRGPQNVHQHFDINEHLPWMIVLFLLLVLVVIVVCSVRKSSRTLKKGPRQDPSAIVEKAIMKKSTTPTQNREKWIYYCNGHGEQWRLGAAGGSVLCAVPCGALEGPPLCPVTSCFSDLLGLVARTEPIYWFLRCVFSLGFSPFLFPWRVPAPEGRVHGGNVTCLPQPLSFSFPPILGRRILNEGCFLFFFLPFPLFFCFALLIFAVTQAWVWLSFMSSFPSPHLFLGG